MPLGRRATIEAKISSEMPLPMPALGDQLADPHQQDAAGRQTDHDQEDVRRVEVRDDRFAGFRLQRVEQEDVADRLGEGQADGQVARVLRDPRLPTSPSLESFSSEGTATCSSCRMIEEVM